MSSSLRYLQAMKNDDVYTHGHHTSVVDSHATRSIADSASYLEPFLKHGQSLLDVGCGPGTITVEFVDRVAPGPVLGIDVSADVIANAQGRFPDSAAAFEVMDLYNLDIADDTYDVSHAHQVLQHVTEPVQALREMRRVVKPGGIVAVRDADYAAMHWSPETPPLDAWMRIYQQVAKSNDAEPNAGRHLQRWAREAGFSDITPSVSTWLYASPERTAWLSSTWAQRSTQSAFAEQAVEREFATAEAMADIAAGWHAWAAGDHPWFVMNHTELICRA